MIFWTLLVILTGVTHTSSVLYSPGNLKIGQNESTSVESIINSRVDSLEAIHSLMKNHSDNQEHSEKFYKGMASFLLSYSLDYEIKLGDSVISQIYRLLVNRDVSFLKDFFLVEIFLNKNGKQDNFKIFYDCHQEYSAFTFKHIILKIRKSIGYSLDVVAHLIYLKHELNSFADWSDYGKGKEIACFIGKRQFANFSRQDDVVLKEFFADKSTDQIALFGLLSTCSAEKAELFKRLVGENAIDASFDFKSLFESFVIIIAFYKRCLHSNSEILLKIKQKRSFYKSKLRGLVLMPILTLQFGSRTFQRLEVFNMRYGLTLSIELISPILLQYQLGFFLILQRGMTLQQLNFFLFYPHLQFQFGFNYDEELDSLRGYLEKLKLQISKRSSVYEFIIGLIRILKGDVRQNINDYFSTTG